MIVTLIASWFVLLPSCRLLLQSHWLRDGNQMLGGLHARHLLRCQSQQKLSWYRNKCNKKEVDGLRVIHRNCESVTFLAVAMLYAEATTRHVSSLELWRHRVDGSAKSWCIRVVLVGGSRDLPLPADNCALFLAFSLRYNANIWRNYTLYVFA